MYAYVLLILKQKIKHLYACQHLENLKCVFQVYLFIWDLCVKRCQLTIFWEHPEARNSNAETAYIFYIIMSTDVSLQNYVQWKSSENESFSFLREHYFS